MREKTARALVLAAALVAVPAFLTASPAVQAGAPTSCGNGVVDSGEECDDGNSVSGDGCSSGCRFEGACCSEGCFVTTVERCVEIGTYIGDGTTCTEEICDMLLVTMDSMSAKAMPAGVLLRWTTVIEIDTIGFRVLREDPTGRREKGLSIVAELIPSAGHGLAGATYELFDNAPAAARAAHYYLEDIDIHGKVTRHGPIVVDRGLRRAAGSRIAR
jgi:cysteine-rich repeat protein